jgi:chromosome segregation ATPase
MVLVASKERSRFTQGSPPGDLCLRVVGSARDGQVVRLTAAKCAIGSAEGCTLRLRARGVRPVHCLVLRGANGTVARSWAPNTQINGEPFRDAVLEAGDRLTIGPVEFEVLAAEGPQVDPTDAGRTVVLDRRPADRTLKADFAPAERLQAFAPRTVKRSTHWRSHVRKLVGEVRKLRSQIDEFNAISSQAPPAAEANELREKLDHHRKLNEQWETTLRELQAELNSREGSLAGDLANLEAERQSLAAERQESQAESDARHRDLFEREQSHRQAADALKAAQAAFDAQRNGHEAELQAAREQLVEREMQLQALAGQQGDAARQLEEAARRSGELDERMRTLEARERDLAESLAAFQQTNEGLAACQSAFETKQRERQSELDERQAALTAREAAHAEALAAHENRQNETQAAHETLAQRQADLERALAALASQQELLSAERQNHEAAVQSQTEEIARREAELAERETLQANAANELSQHAFDTVVAEPNGQETGELAARRAELERAEAALQQAASDLAAAKAQFETQQAEEIAERQRMEDELAAAAKEIVAGKNAVAEAESHLRAERESLFNERLSQEAELRQASETLERRIVEQNERERQAAAETLTPAQPLVDPVQAEELAEREAKLAEQFAEFERRQASLREEREEFDHSRTRSSQRLDADAEELKQERAELEAERAELAAELEKLAADREAFEAERQSSFDRRDAEQASEGRRSAQTYDADADEEEDEATEQPLQEFSRALPPSRRQTQIDTVRSAPGDTARAPQGEEEESIEQYMAALLNRSRSGQVAPTSQPVERRRNKRKSDVQTTEVESPETPVAAPEVPVLDIPAAPVQLERRRVPEVRPDMNVLREIGITHARSAIATHGQQRSLKQAYGTLATSVLCFVAAFFVFYFSTQTVFRLTGMAIVVIGIYWLGTSIWAINKVLNSMQQRRGGLRATLAEIDAEIEALRKETEAETEAAK